MEGYTPSKEWIKAWEKAHNEIPISSGSTESQRKNIMKYCVTKTDVVRYVKHRLNEIKKGSQLTMTIEAEKSGGYYVSDVTGLSSEDTQTEDSYDLRQNT